MRTVHTREPAGSATPENTAVCSQCTPLPMPLCLCKSCTKGSYVVRVVCTCEQAGSATHGTVNSAKLPGHMGCQTPASLPCAAYTSKAEHGAECAQRCGYTCCHSTQLVCGIKRLLVCAVAQAPAKECLTTLAVAPKKTWEHQ